MSMSVRARSFSMPRSSVLVASLFAFSLCLLATVALAASDEERQPAVKARNSRVVGSYDYTHIDSDEAFDYSSGSPVLTPFPEVDIDSGSIIGTLTFPIHDSIGGRVLAGPVGSKSHVDAADATRRGGMLLGGDLFWRDPEVGEVGLGPRYLWTESNTGDYERSNHALGAALTTSLFLQDFGVGPIDLDFEALFFDDGLGTNGGPPRREDYFAAGGGSRTYSASGGATLYLSDGSLAVGLGGRWARKNYGTGEHQATRAADIDLEVLLPIEPTITLGANISLGDRDVSVQDTANFGQTFFSLGVSVTVSFPGAKSLVELNRHYY